jgi:hypothetical protein
VKTGVQRSKGEVRVNNQLSVDYDYLWTMPPSFWTFRQKRKASCILTVETSPRLDEEIRYSFLRTMHPGRLYISSLQTISSRGLCLFVDYTSSWTMPLRGLYLFVDHPFLSLKILPKAETSCTLIVQYISDFARELPLRGLHLCRFSDNPTVFLRRTDSSILIVSLDL